MLTVTVSDLANLSLVESPELQRLLEHARVVPLDGVPADLVTMYSSVLCVDRVTGERHVLVPVFPEEEDLAAGRLSVAGAGLALLGATPGRHIECDLPSGTQRRLRIEALLYQPEHDLRTNLVLRG